MLRRPTFHLGPEIGWVNDPNAPILNKGRYHLFYQHLPGSVHWSFGLQWGHSVSDDLVHWRHLPPALVPTPGHYDQDGCFSGCCTIDTDGRPTILYTGVVKRPDAPALGHINSLNVSKLCVEVQLAAVASDPDDPDLVHWTKLPMPQLSAPPAGPKVNSWRDPFIASTPVAAAAAGLVTSSPAPLAKGGSRAAPSASGTHAAAGAAGSAPAAPPTMLRLSNAGEQLQARQLPGRGLQGQPAAGDAWLLMIGSGVRTSAGDHRGTALVYSSIDLTSGSWRYEGPLCEPSADNGPLWECPLLLCPPVEPASTASPEQQPGQRGADTPLLLVASVGSAPSLYWLGHSKPAAGLGSFDMSTAHGPLPLDLGDSLYAPNVLRDAAGRLVLWGWLRERYSPEGGPAPTIAGCMTVPRVLSLRAVATGTPASTPAGAARAAAMDNVSSGGASAHAAVALQYQLWQEPLPELEWLRTGSSWCCSCLPLKQGMPLDIPGSGAGTSAAQGGLPAGLLAAVHVDIWLRVLRGSSRQLMVRLRPWEATGSAHAAVVDAHASNGPAGACAPQPASETANEVVTEAAEAAAEPAAGHAAPGAAGADVALGASLVYDWCSGVLVVLPGQLDSCRCADVSGLADSPATAELLLESARQGGCSWRMAAGGRLAWPRHSSSSSSSSSSSGGGQEQVAGNVSSAARSCAGRGLRGTSGTGSGTSSAVAVAGELPDELELRLLLDWSVLEVFCPATGQALACRLFRGWQPVGQQDSAGSDGQMPGAGATASVQVVALGGDSELEECAMHEMGSLLAAS